MLPRQAPLLGVRTPVREVAWKEVFPMQYENRGAHRFVRSRKMRMSNNGPNTNRLAISALPRLNVTMSQSSQSEPTLRVSCTGSRFRLMTLIEASAGQIVHLCKRVDSAAAAPGLCPCGSALKRLAFLTAQPRNVLFSAIFFPAMIGSLANSGDGSELHSPFKFVKAGD
jgi:hypothetical protein